MTTTISDLATAGAAAMDTIFTDLSKSDLSDEELVAARDRASAVLGRALDLTGEDSIVRGFDESQHPRDENGRWSRSGGGGGVAALTKPMENAPSAADLASTKAGDMVKVRLTSKDGRTVNGASGERVWLNVTGNSAGHITGTVDNAVLNKLHGVKSGDTLTVAHDHVFQTSASDRIGLGDVFGGLAGAAAVGLAARALRGEAIEPEDSLLRGSAAPSSVDLPNRKFRATIISRTNDVERTSKSGRKYIERIDIGSIDHTRLRGLPVIFGHTIPGANSTERAQSILGAVTDTGIDEHGVWGEFQLNKGSDDQFAQVASGRLRGVSFGFHARNWSTETAPNGVPVMNIREFAPFEVSLLHAPCDAGAQVRGNTMTTAAAASNRQEYCKAVRGIAAGAGLPTSWADERIDQGFELTAIRGEAFEHMTSRSPASAHAAQSLGIDPAAVIHRGMSDALACKLNPSLPGTEQGLAYANWSLLDFAAELSRLRGRPVDRNDRPALADAILRGDGGQAMSSADFPELLADSARKALMPSWQAAAPSYRQWATQRSFVDFKPARFLRVGELPQPTEMVEGQEPKYGTLSENRETITPKEYGFGVSIGRKALLQDDLGALSGLANMAGIRVAQWENSSAYGVLIANPNLSDGNAVCSNAHGNLMSATTVDVTNVGLAVKALRKMTGLDGMPLNIMPRYLVCGPAKELVARQLLTQITPNTTAAVNPWSSMFVLIVDSNITDNSWWIMADNSVPTVVYGYVAGATGPSIRSEINFSTRALDIIVNVDFGIGAIDHRGIVFNPGA